jgi:predicted  nucleic acid-binding Zn-ribbon protein
LKGLKVVIAEKEKEIEVLRKQMETITEGKTETNKQLDAFNDKIAKVNAEITALFKKKDEQREAHFKERYDYEVQRELIQHINWIKDQKEAITALE